MTNDARRNEIQRLADKHQDVIQQQVYLGREIAAANFEASPNMLARLGRLIEAEMQARAEFDVACEGWHETVYVKPIR